MVGSTTEDPPTDGVPYRTFYLLALNTSAPTCNCSTTLILYRSPLFALVWECNYKNTNGRYTLSKNESIHMPGEASEHLHARLVR